MLKGLAKRHAAVHESRRELQRTRARAERARDVYLLAVAALSIERETPFMVISRAHVDAAAKTVKTVTVDTDETTGDVTIAVTRELEQEAAPAEEVPA